MVSPKVMGKGLLLEATTEPLKVAVSGPWMAMKWVLK
jgi:hypothetical protein